VKTTPKYRQQIVTSGATLNFSRRAFLGTVSTLSAFLPARAASVFHGNDGFSRPLAHARGVATAANPIDFYRPPQLSLMVGFIKDPEHRNFSLEERAKGIGKDFNAKKLVADAKSAGMAEIIWYDKWIDGLVFRKTKTTNFVTERDFLADLGPGCQRAPQFADKGLIV